MIGTLSLTDEISGRMTDSCLCPFSWENLPGSMRWSREEDIRRAFAPWIVSVLTQGQERSTCQATQIIASRWETEFTPRTDLGPERAIKAIALLDQWLNDDSGYDEETWPELKKSLDRERLSNRRLFDAESDPS